MIRLRKRWHVCVAAMLLLMGSLGRARATADGVVQGVVKDEMDAGVDKATVVLHDPRGNTVAKAVTKSDGAFTFTGIPFGDYTVEGSAKGKVEDHRHVLISSSATTTVELYCLVPTAVTYVEETAEVAAPAKATGSITTLSREALKEQPKGEDRPITEVLGTQPGFVLDAFGNVYARGNHANIQYQVDGVPLPDSVGNLFAAALPVRLIQNLEIFTGGIPAEFGDRLSAVVNITSRHGAATPDGSVQLRYGSFNTVEPSVSYSRTFGKLSAFVGGSYEYSQRALDPPAVSPIIHDDGQNGRLFLRLDYTLTARDTFELFASYAYNFFQIPIDPTVAPLDPANPNLVRPVDQYGNASPPFVPHNTNATEKEHEVFAMVSYVHTFENRGQLQVAPYYKLSYGALNADAANALGVTADPGATASDVTRVANHGGAIAHYSIKLGNHVIKAGAQFDYLGGTTNFTQYTRNDNDGGGIASAAPGTDNTQAILWGLYLQDRWERGRFTLNAGIRLDEQHVSVASGTNDQVGGSPRLGVSFAFVPEFVTHAFVGINWQPPAPLDASNAARILGIVPASEKIGFDLKAQTDLYGELGFDWRIKKVLKLGAVGWSRYAWNQLDDTAIGSTNLIANYNFQRGRAVGVEGKAEYVFRYWLSVFGNLSWEIAQGQGVSSAKYLFTAAELANNAWQTLDHAQTLTANIGATLREGGASLSAIGTYASGLRTGPTNNATVPGHFKLDGTLQYAFDKIPLKPKVAIDLINILDSHYAYRIANGFVGSSYGAPRSFFIRLVIPLSLGGQS